MNNLLFTSHKVRETRSFPKKIRLHAKQMRGYLTNMIILLCFPYFYDNKGDRKFKDISKDIYDATLPSALNFIFVVV